MKKLWQEPLFHFLLFGVGLFLLYSFLNPQEEQLENDVILIDNSDVQRLTKAYQQSWSTPPDSVSLSKLIAEEVKAEVFYREALRMQLDHNDEIIRRRLKQKYEFLVKDLADSQQPNEDEIKQFYTEHADLYQAPAKLSFTHIYFNPDKRAQALQDAQNVYNKISNTPLNQVDFKKLGDSFHLLRYYADRDYNDVRQLLGKDFANGIFQHSQEGWISPIRSGYGIHLVHVSGLQKSFTQPLESVKARVLEDWKITQQQKYNEQLYDNLLPKYKVVYELGGRQ